MRLLAFSEGRDHVCCRYRVAALAPALTARGWELQVEPLADSWRTRLAQFNAAADYDVVLLQRKLLPLWQTWWLRRRARALVYDFDDAMPFRDSFSERGAQSASRSARFGRLVRAADLVLAGNAYLERLARERRPRGAVQYLPTVVDPSRYALAGHIGHSGPLRLVWIGQRTTVPYLQAAGAALAAATARVPRLALHVISDAFPQLPGVSIAPIRWTSEGETRALVSADVGVSWLTDDPWSRGKCGLKVLQYMAAGLPVVANRVGVHSELVEHGVTGYLADTPGEWAEAIGRLDDPQRRARFGEAGRRRVERDYNVADWSPRWADAIAGLTARAPESKSRRNDAGHSAAGSSRSRTVLEAA